MERRLVAIMAADVVGYSARVEKNETATLALLRALKAMFDGRVAEAGGRVFSHAGDGFLAEFKSPVAAVQTGFEIQRDLAQARLATPDMLELRIGVHLADVVVDGDDLLGDGVNIAARIESIADPGSVTVSRAVFDQVKRTAGLTFESVGPRRMKNLAEAMVLYRVAGEVSQHSFTLGQNESSADLSTSDQAVDGRPSVAVLPFVNRSDSEEQQYFVDGFTEDLITELSRFSTLFVSSRNASLAYRGKDVTVNEAGRHLGVDYCLEGSVRRMGTGIRISVRLSRADTEESVWANRYDCNLEETFDVQDEIVASIVSTVAGRVEKKLLGDAKRKRPADLNAYDCVLRGLEHHRLGGVTLDDAKAALEWFGKAIEIDPDYARAHAWWSCSRHALGEWLDDDWWQESLASVEKALELDENDAEAHRIMGVMCMMSGQWDKSRHHFERALEINPNHANVVARAGEIYNFMGDPQRALELVERAMRLDPFLPDYGRQLEIAALYHKEDYGGAVAAAECLNRPNRRAAAYIVAALTHLEEKERLARAVSELLRIDPNFKISSFLKTEYYREPDARNRLKEDLACAGLPQQ